MGVSDRRFQQAAFEVAASLNRLQGSGGGSGLGPVLLAQASFGTVDPFHNVGANPTVISGTPSGQTYSVTLQANRTILIWSLAFLNASFTTTGAAGQWEWGVSTDSTSAIDATTFGPLLDTANAGIVSTVSTSMQFVAPGSHTIRLLGFPMAAAQNAHCHDATIYVFQLT